MNTLFVKHPELLPQKDIIENVITALVDCYKNGGKILVCGNGGSSSDSAHIVGELMKGFMQKRPVSAEYYDKVSEKLQMGVPAIDLTAQSGLISAFANDVDAELIYAQQVFSYGINSKNDVVIGLSTSGNSKNVVEAIKTGNAIGLKTIAFTGEKESLLSEIAAYTIKAPACETYLIQEYHLPIYHYICQRVEEILFK